MKLNCGKTTVEKREDKKKWHWWFAWYPIRVGPQECLWLEKILRKGTREKYYSGHGCHNYYWDWQYTLEDKHD